MDPIGSSESHWTLGGPGLEDVAPVYICIDYLL